MQPAALLHRAFPLLLPFPAVLAEQRVAIPEEVEEVRAALAALAKQEEAARLPVAAAAADQTAALQQQARPLAPVVKVILVPGLVLLARQVLAVLAQP